MRATVISLTTDEYWDSYRFGYPITDVALVELLDSLVEEEMIVKMRCDRMRRGYLKIEKKDGNELLIRALKQMWVSNMSILSSSERDVYNDEEINEDNNKITVLINKLEGSSLK